ncbi:hypothetical protein BDR07DRAFT_1445907 [Suillus spraguei]|nr:hypothetical protein BDR07DRAFT_1445907 [Suillus spraguei]
MYIVQPVLLDSIAELHPVFSPLQVGPISSDVATTIQCVQRVYFTYLYRAGTKTVYYAIKLFQITSPGCLHQNQQVRKYLRHFLYILLDQQRTACCYVQIH